MQAAQLIHAAGESSLLTQIPLGTNAVALQIDNEVLLFELAQILEINNISHIKVIENDEPYTGQLMAIGLAPQLRTAQLKRILGKLRLI